MKKKALKKDFHMEIKKSLNRFLSIFFIVALGVSFFSGIQASAPDMRATGDYYFDSTNLMDIRVISTLGLTEDDLEAIRAVEGVGRVEGCYMEDVYCETDDSREVLHIESLPERLNQVSLEEGEVPKTPGECFLDSSYAVKHGYKPGDTLEITVASEEDSNLKRRAFTISGYGHSPCYVSFNRGSTTLGAGSVAGFAYVLAEDFDAEVYSVAYAQATGAKEVIAFTDRYDDLVDAVYDRVEGIKEVRCEARYDEVTGEANEKIGEARREVARGKRELADAKRELEDAKADAESELLEAESELLDGEKQIRDGELGLDDARKEIADGERELADGEVEIADSSQKLADGKIQLADGQSKLISGEKEYQSGLEAYNTQSASAKKKLTAAQKEIDKGRTQIEGGWRQYRKSLAEIEDGRQKLDAAEKQLTRDQATYDAGAAQIAQGRASYEAGIEQYEEGLAEYHAGMASLEAGIQEYNNALAPLQSAVVAADQALEECNQKAGAKRAEYDAQADRLQAALGALAAVQEELAELEANPVPQPQPQPDPDHPGATIAPDTTKYDEYQAQLAAAQQRVAQQQSAVDSLIQEVDRLEAECSALIQEQAEKAAARTEAETALSEASASLAGQKALLDQTGVDLAQRKQQLDGTLQLLTETKKTLDAKEAELADAGKELSDGWQALNEKKAELSAGSAHLEQSRAALESKENELEAAQKQVDNGYRDMKRELKKAQAKLSSARSELESGWAKLSASRRELADGERQLGEGRNQLYDARVELEDARQQLADAKKELAENDQKIKNGWKDYEEGKKEAEEKLADGERKIKDAEQEIVDAEQEIAEAQQKLSKLRFPQWYVDDRNALPENSGFGENAERLSNIAKVVPLLFFFVAALISLTTMTRMVEEERTQIGTLKALGYSKASIASKYLKYAFWATIGGSVFGFLVGEKIFPWVIINAYGIMYQYLPRILLPYHWEYAAIATGAALFCTIGATLSSCYHELLSVPAQLMRPPAPKEGKRVWIEYLPFIWRSLSFTWKSTVRNLFRYKKRFLMTVIGIGGCMGLLLVGYGLQDSIMDIGVLQFEELQLYDAMAIVDLDASREEQEEVLQEVKGDERIAYSKRFMMQMQDIRTDEITNKKWSVYVYVPENLDDIDEFLRFQDRETKEPYTLTDEGAIITEKVSNELKLHPGDMILLKRDDREDIEVPILAVCENYLSHYLYMTPALYERLYKEAPEYNSIFFKGRGEQEAVEDIGEKLLKKDAVLNITYTGMLAEQINSMLGAMDVVMIVLIVSAGMLAFVVLYNLNNININERRRELATLKVLGFYNGETASYVYRENILLTVIGTALGILIGKILHAFVIAMVEVDACMFGRNINLPSFMYGTLLTIGFSAIVNGVMYFKLRKIDMVESLKSIE